MIAKMNTQNCCNAVFKRYIRYQKLLRDELYNRMIPCSSYGESTLFCFIICFRYGTRSDAGCHYWLNVRLLNGDLEEIDSRSVKEEKDATGEWFQASIVIKEILLTFQ